MGIISAILVLSFLVFFHELGHFLAAKVFGVRVEAFSIGFGKTRLLKKQIGETEYSLRPIPLGGFVQLKGQNDFDPTIRDTSSDSLYGVQTYKRLIILSAGSLFNLLLAFLLFVVIGLIGKSELAPVIGKVEENMPAAIAGLQSGDEILSINGQRVLTWEALSQKIAKSNGVLEITFSRDFKEYQTILTPKLGNSKNIFGESISRPLIGIISSGEIRIVSYSLLDSFVYAFHQTLESSQLILQSIQKLIFGIVPLSEVGGVVSIVSITKKASELGIVDRKSVV